MSEPMGVCPKCGEVVVWDFDDDLDQNNYCEITMEWKRCPNCGHTVELEGENDA